MTPPLRAGARRAMEIVLDRQVGCPNMPAICTHPDQAHWCSYCLLRWALSDPPPVMVTDSQGTRPA